MKNVLIVGASGMIGGIVLRECLNSDQVNKVTSIGRRKLKFENSKLKQIVHNDFTDYSKLENEFAHVDAAFFCIGEYTGSVPDEKFKMITVDFAKAFANTLKDQSPNATLCFLSGQGADQKEKSRMSFARYKGMAENHLISKDFPQLYIFRPGYIYPVKRRKEPNWSYSLMRSLYPLMKRFYASGVITSEELGKAMFKAGMQGASKMILENQDIKLIV